MLICRMEREEKVEEEGQDMEMREERVSGKKEILKHCLKTINYPKLIMYATTGKFNTFSS